MPGRGTTQKMKSNWLGGTGSMGGVLASAGCPACIPALGAVFSSIGLGFTIGIKLLGIITIALLALGVFGLYGNYRRHGKTIFLFIGLIASVALYAAQYTNTSEPVFYGGAGILLLNAVLDYRHTKKHKSCCSPIKK